VHWEVCKFIHWPIGTNALCAWPVNITPMPVPGARFVAVVNTKIKTMVTQLFLIRVRIVQWVDILWIQPRMQKNTTNNKIVFIACRVQKLSMTLRFVLGAKVANIKIKETVHCCQSLANFVTLEQHFKVQQKIALIVSEAGTKIVTMNRRRPAVFVKQVRCPTPRRRHA
jgi:hypothetical protein